MYKYFIIIGLSLNSQLLQAQDLMDIYRLALEQDAEYKIALSEYQAIVESLPLAISERRPQVDLSANITKRGTDGFSDSANTSDSYGYRVELTQALYNAEILSSIDAAEADVAKARADLEFSHQELILRVGEHYFDILAAQDNLEFAEAEENAIARQLEQAKKRFEVGLIAITDVREAQARYDIALARSILAENLLDNANQALQVIIAEAPSTSIASLGEALELNIPEPADIRQWVDLSLQNNQSLVAVLAAQKAAEFKREGIRKSNYPTVELIASYSDINFDNPPSGDTNQQDLILSIKLNLPLFTGGRINAERQQAEANYRTARNVVLLQKRLTSQQTRNAYLGVLSGISQVKALKQALSSSRTALEATEAGFEVGTRTSVDVLISLQETYRAQRDYASARYDYLLNTLRLKQAAGLLNAEDLQQLNHWLTAD
ncbi:MAG: TolC family outer membrane protein [Proteobacteria bacterium]|nr:TolC family outer membrane protein [Pseudomonadota bacterium]